MKNKYRLKNKTVSSFERAYNKAFAMHIWDKINYIRKLTITNRESIEEFTKRMNMAGHFFDYQLTESYEDKEKQ